MTAGGSLLIKTRNVEIGDKRGAMAPGRYVQLAVSDTGSGMAQEVQAHAFEPFFTTKPRGEATGLGLSTVYGIVTEAGGTVQISSDPGHGTIVQIYLPATTATPGTAVAVEGAAPEGAAEGGETVLVVEDEDAIRRVAERILSSAGYRVITVSGKDAALDACQNEETIDLLLTDVVMPGLLGPELVAHATRVRPGVKVLYMSGYIHQMTEHLGHAHEDFGFVAKPFTADTLLTGVREALDAS
jgi:CheY-like chemotaxis protein